jgi:predicted RNA-binding Zn ribbon-like protein
MKAFSLCGGSLCLDFVNTVDERPGYADGLPAPAHADLLSSWSDFVDWARQAGAANIKKATAVTPNGAKKRLLRFQHLREQIFRVLLSVVMHKTPPAREVAAINSELAKLSPIQLWVHNRELRASRNPPETFEDIVLNALLQDLMLLLQRSDLSSRLRVCSADECGWLFLDTSKSGRRRWCDMSDCGNREKARRFAQRESR